MSRKGLIVVTQPKGGFGPRFEAIKKRARSPMTGGGGTLAIQAIQRGPGSVENQFLSQSTFGRGGGRRPWKKTEAFGSRPAPTFTLVRTGGLMRAWTGRGAGSETFRSQRHVRVGVDRTRFPQAGRLNGDRTVFSKARKSGARGRSKMHWFLGMNFGVWISDKKLRSRGLPVVPRPVGVNPTMLKRVANRVIEWVLEGNAQSARGI